MTEAERPGQDVEIRVRPTRKQHGKLSLVA